MTKRQLEKVRERFEDLDLSRYRILTYDEMLKVNGGSGSDSDDDDDELEDNFENEETSDVGNSTSAGSANEAGDAAEENGKDAEEEPEEDYHVTSHAEVANAEVGDTATRSDGTEVTLTEADIEYEQNYCDAHGIDWNRGDEEETASANAGEAAPSEEDVAENLPEEETDDGGSSDSDTPAQEQESVASSESGAGRTDGTDSSATDSVKADCDEEKADSAGKNSESTADNEAKNSGENKSDASESETKGNEKQAEGHSENTAKSGSDASNKENSSTPQENSRSADAAHQSASQTSQTAAAPNTEKEEHGFLDSVKEFFSDIKEAAKDWVSDLFGFGDGKNDGEKLEGDNNNSHPSTQPALEHQTPENPNDYHCDIKAYNKALDNGLDPRGQKGENWDGNGVNVNQVFDLYPSGRTSVPQSNTSGYVFYDWQNDGKYDHMEFYSAGAGSNYSVMYTDGISTPVEHFYDSTIDSNGTAGPGTATYVSLPELGEMQ